MRQKDLLSFVDSCRSCAWCCTSWPRGFSRAGKVSTSVQFHTHSKICSTFP